MTTKYLLRVDLLLAHRGKELIVPAALDTGAEGFIVLNRREALELGLELGDLSYAQGVGGMVPTWSSMANRVSFSAPGCALEKVPISVMDLEISGARALVGEDFLKSIKATIEMTPDGVMVKCAAGPKVAIASGRVINVGWPVGAAFGLAAAFVFLVGYMAIEGE